MSSFVLHCLRSGDTVLSHSLLSEIAPSEDPVAGRHGAASLGATVSWLESAHADSSLTGLLGMTAPGKVPNKGGCSMAVWVSIILLERRGWSTVSTYCSCRGPRPGSQHPCNHVGGLIYSSMCVCPWMSMSICVEDTGAG